jgi:hypothetical protein
MSKTGTIGRFTPPLIKMGTGTSIGIGKEGPQIDTGLFIKFPNGPSQILSKGELLLLPQSYILPKENLLHESQVSFVRLNHTVEYQDGIGIQLCCTPDYFSMMQNILQMVRDRKVFHADFGQRMSAPDYALRAPGLKRLDLAKATPYQIFPQEITKQYEVKLPVIYPHNINEETPRMVQFRLVLEYEDMLTRQTAIFDPRKSNAIELIHFLMNYDFRALIVSQE